MPPLWSNNVLALACVLAIGVGSELAPDAARAGQRETTPKPDELLKRFPIGTTPVTPIPIAPSTPTAPEPPPVVTEPPAAVIQRSSEGDAGLGVALGVGAGAFGLLAAFATWRVRRQSGSKGRGSDRATEPVAIAPVPVEQPGRSSRQLQLALAQQEWDGSSSGQAPPANRAARRSRPVREVSQDRNRAESQPTGPALPPVETAGQAPPSREQDYAGVGGRVAGILEAAEAAAAEIRAEAVAVLAGAHDRAKLEASTQLRQAEQDAAKLRSEAEASANETRSAAESYGTRQRREAEEEAGKVLTEAEAQARATRQAAEGMARQIEVAAREREEALRAQLLPLEAKLRRALDGFRGISNQLEELLDGKQGGGESLVEALGVSARKPAAWEEKV